MFRLAMLRFRGNPASPFRTFRIIAGLQAWSETSRKLESVLQAPRRSAHGQSRRTVSPPGPRIFAPYIEPYLCIALHLLKLYNGWAKKVRFEWDETKDKENQKKHGVSFWLAQRAFFDPHRVIAEAVSHRAGEERFSCMDRVNDAIITVRFTYRGNVIRIYGAGYWRKGRKIYEDQNKIHRWTNGKTQNS